MTVIEKLIVAAIVGILLVLGTIVYSTTQAISDNGGIKEMIITAGKDIKVIYEEIQEEE